MKSQYKPKQLPKKEESIDLNKLTSFSYFLIRRFPFYLKYRRQIVKLTKYTKMLTPLAIIVVSTFLSIIVMIDRMTKTTPPPHEAAGFQLNIILMSILLLIIFFWGFGCKLMRVQIPRGAAGF